MSKVTIEDISRHTGLSRGTVSRALNNRPDISLQTKQRVLDACQQLNYVPSHAARSLATGRCFAVAVVVDDLRSAFSSAFLRGVLTRARADQYAVFAAELAADASATIENVSAMAGERVDSILVGTPVDAPQLQKLYTALENRPLVAFDTAENANCDVFRPDFVEAGRIVARHLFAGGTSNVLYVHEGGTLAADQARLGVEEVCRTAGTNPDDVIVALTGTGAERLGSLRDRLTTTRALAASTDFLAIELMLAARGLGRNPGQDLAVIGQGNSLAGTSITPTLTTVDFCGEEIGRRALDIALQRITKSRQDAPLRTDIPPQLRVRQTTQQLGPLQTA